MAPTSSRNSVPCSAAATLPSMRRVAVAREEPLRERREMARHALDGHAVLLGERSGCPALEVEDAARRILPDRRAEHRLDARDPHAAPVAEALVEERRRRDDRPPGRDR